jgi:hypothetical protein
MVGEAIGIAAALAVHTQTPIESVPVKPIQELQSQRYQAHYGQPLQPCGKALWAQAECENHPLLLAEQALVTSISDGWNG